MLSFVVAQEPPPLVNIVQSDIDTTAGKVCMIINRTPYTKKEVNQLVYGISFKLRDGSDRLVNPPAGFTFADTAHNQEIILQDANRIIDSLNKTCRTRLID
jgi:hypothetical protein